MSFPKIVGFALIVVAGVAAILWLENHSSKKNPGFTFGFGAGSLPPFLVSGQTNNTMGGGPGLQAASSYVQVPQVFVGQY